MQKCTNAILWRFAAGNEGNGFDWPFLEARKQLRESNAQSHLLPTLAIVPDKLLSQDCDIHTNHDGMTERQQPQLSLAHQRIIQGCCALAERLLSKSDATSDWTTFAPFFLEQAPFETPPTYSEYRKEPIVIDWESLPDSLRPCSGQLDQERASNKQLQITSMLQHALPLVDQICLAKTTQSTVHVVEFGSGSGHVGLVLAHLRPDIHVTLVERKQYACNVAQRRARDAHLQNVSVVCSTLHAFAGYDPATESISSASPLFHLGLSLHSCGVLTDAAIELCLHHRAAFLLCPCCYGQSALHLPDNYLPRSDPLQGLRKVSTPTLSMEGASSKERRRMRQLTAVPPFYNIARAADCTSAVNTSFINSDNFMIAKRCMQLVDADRLLWVQQQHGYRVSMASLEPLEVTPKNNLILGVPLEETGLEKVAMSLTAMAASSSETVDAEKGERQKTGFVDFGTSQVDD